MSFLQIVSFHTDRIEAFEELDRRWVEETEGRRTVLDSALYRDRSDPTHYVAVNHFASWEEAQVNSHLPETDAFATRAMALADGPAEFTDLDLVRSVDVRATAADGLRRLLETNEVPEHLFADDLRVDLFVPNWHVVVRSVDEMMVGMREEASSRTLDQWDVHPVADGVIVEYAARNHATATQPETLSVGTVAARLQAGRIASLRVHCAGNWTAELQHQISESQTAGVPA